MKRTLVGAWSRDWVFWKMLVGPKKGRVEARKTRAEMKRKFSAREVSLERGFGGMFEGARRER